MHSGLKWVVRPGSGRAALLLTLVAVLLLGGGGALAQDDAAARVRAAYEDYETWDTFTVEGEVTAWSAIVAEGTYGSNRSLWRRQERGAVLIGQYDRTDPGNAVILLHLDGDAELSVEQDGTEMPSSWDVSMDVALLDGTLNWRGSYEADPDGGFTLPEDWAEFSPSDLTAVPAFMDLTLGRYLGQEDADPFIGDYAAWLAAAESIEGPSPIRLGGGATGEMYTITLPLAAAPELIGSRVSLLTEGQGAIVGRDVLLGQLAESGTLVWRVVLDPESGRLVGQELQGDVRTELSGDMLAEPYASLSVAYNERQSVLFRDVNQPVEPPELTDSQGE